jgi:hypothetical protein
MIHLYHAQTCAIRQYLLLGEVAAKSFVLYVGHLGRSEPVVLPATQTKEVAHEALYFGFGGGGDGGDDGCAASFCQNHLRGPAPWASPHDWQFPQRGYGFALQQSAYRRGGHFRLP